MVCKFRFYDEQFPEEIPTRLNVRMKLQLRGRIFAVNVYAVAVMPALRDRLRGPLCSVIPGRATIITASTSMIT